MKPTNLERARACVAAGSPVYPLPALAAVDILALLDQVEADARRAALEKCITMAEEQAAATEAENKDGSELLAGWVDASRALAESYSALLAPATPARQDEGGGA